MADDLKVAIVAFTNGTGTAGSTWDVTLSGFGTPNAAIVFFGHDDSFTSSVPRDNFVLSVGFTDGTSQRCITGVVDDRGSGGVTNCDRQAINDRLLVQIGTDGNLFSEHSFDSWITDGIRFSVDDQDTIGRGGFVMLIQCKGALIQDVDNTAGSDVVTFTGITPKLLFGISCRDAFAAASAASSAGLYLGWGWCHNGTSIQQMTQNHAYENGQSTSDQNMVLSDTLMMHDLNPSGPTFEGGWDVTTFSGSDVTFAQHTGASTNGVLGSVLALEIGDGEVDIGSKLSDNDTGADAVTGVGFTPDALYLFMNRDSGWDADATWNNAGILSCGGASATGTTETVQQRALFGALEGGTSANNADCTVGCRESRCINIIQHNQVRGTGNEHDASLQSFDADGFTLNFHVVGGADRYGYVAFKNAVGGVAAAADKGWHEWRHA